MDKKTAYPHLGISARPRNMDLIGLLQSGGYDIFKEIVACLSPIDILNLAATCKSLHNIKDRCWQINAHLTKFVDNPNRFRSMMAKHDALVSGSNALQFLERCYWSDGDLDLYVSRKGSGVIDFVNYLIREERYKLMPYCWQEGASSEEIVNKTLNMEFLQSMSNTKWNRELPAFEREKAKGFYEMKHISGVFTLERTRTGKIIQVIASKGAPLAAIINDFYATCILNFYSWNRAYSVFPLFTFEYRISLITHPLNTDKLKAAINKYTERGYRGMRELNDYLASMVNCPIRASRRVGDRYSWVMELDTTGVNVSSFELTPDDVLDYSCFSICRTQHRTDYEGELISFEDYFYELACVTLDSCVLKHSYLIEPRKAGDKSWSHSLKKTVDEHARRICYFYDDPNILRLGYPHREIPWDFKFPFPRPIEFRYLDETISSFYEYWDNNNKGHISRTGIPTVTYG